VAGLRIGPTHALKVVAPGLELRRIAKQLRRDALADQQRMERAGGAALVKLRLEETVDGVVDGKRQALRRLDAVALLQPEAAGALGEYRELIPRQGEASLGDGNFRGWHQTRALYQA
jgi:hypothetical protein